MQLCESRAIGGRNEGSKVDKEVSIKKAASREVAGTLAVPGSPNRELNSALYSELSSPSLQLHRQSYRTSSNNIIYFALFLARSDHLLHGPATGDPQTLIIVSQTTARRLNL